mmetsp:Transcript_7195/g.29757  ORF Transcript_7195/g.29757 Transcript_7195/m.29757 type:complete len:232 (+) Transcript_7195:34-729(+)
MRRITVVSNVCYWARRCRRSRSPCGAVWTPPRSGPPSAAGPRGANRLARARRVALRLFSPHFSSLRGPTFPRASSSASALSPPAPSPSSPTSSTTPPCPSRCPPFGRARSTATRPSPPTRGASASTNPDRRSASSCESSLRTMRARLYDGCSVLPRSVRRRGRRPSGTAATSGDLRAPAGTRARVRGTRPCRRRRRARRLWTTTTPCAAASRRTRRSSFSPPRPSRPTAPG